MNHRHRCDKDFLFSVSFEMVDNTVARVVALQIAPSPAPAKSPRA
jgi:hypothetical protein